MKSIFYTIIILLTLTTVIISQTKYTWIGGSGSWQTASNWNPNGIPGVPDTAVVNSGTVTNDQSVTIASLFQNGGTINGIGDLTISDSLSFVAGTHGGTGTTTISSTATGSIGGIFTKTLSRMIVNEGSLVWSGTTVSFNSGAGITNNGTFDAQAESFVLGSGGNGSIINNGTFNRTTSLSSATLATTFINNGITNVQSGTLQSTLSTSGSGTFVISPASKYILSGGTHTLSGNTISGGGTLELISGTLNLTGSPVTISSGTTFYQDGGTIAGDGALIINGTFTWLSGTHGGTGTTTISSTATGSIGGIFTKTLSRMIVNEGSLVWGGTTVSFNSGAGITNNGTFDAQAESFVLGSGGNGSIINNGTFYRTTGTGNAQIATKFINNDELSIFIGALSFTDSLLNKTTGIINGNGTLTPPTSNRFINNGIVAPGVSPGILSINGNYPQTTSADLNIEIGGYQVGSERDSLFISGQAQLDGTLNIQFINNFLPQVGDVFTIMKYTSRTGQFSQINFSNNVSGQIQYLSNGAQVLITSGGVNQLPIAVDDAAQTDEDVAVIINVLANDSDPDNDPLSINGFTQPVHGNVVQSGDSSILYTPALNYFGLDSLTYTIQDPNGATATAKVRITILPVNDPPTAPVLLLPVSGDTLNSNQTINFVWNASSDPENNPLSYALRIWGNSLDTTIAGLNDTTLAFNNPNAFQQNNSYQWQITTSDGNLSTLSSIRAFFIQSSALAGIYTIGAMGDFATINDAVSTLKTFGVGGTVTFNILPGIYDEQVVLDSVNGLSSTNSLTIQSQSGNPEDVTWKYSGQAPNSNYVLLLRSILHTTIRGISFIAAKTSAGRLIGLGANSNFIKIENNKLSGVSTSSLSNVYAVINAHNAAIDNIQIVGNKINFGSFAVHLYGFVSQQVSNVTIENNECLGQSFVSIWILNASVVQINNNIIDNGVQLGGGIILNDSYLPISISGNKITTNKWGISLNFNTAGIGEFLVANNFLEVNAPKNNNYPPFAIRSGSNAGISFFYNTLLVVGDTVENSFALRIEFPTSVKEIKNNILMNTARGRALYYQGTIGIESDFNDLFSEGNTLVTWNSSNYSDLASYQAARGQDINSLNVNPSFLSNNDPHLNDFILNNAGTPLAEVTIDIDGEPRHQTTPDIGADEFEPLGFKGIFTIGAGGDFPNITSAVSALKDTIITGAVTFNILTGTYDEQVVIDSVNRIYFGSPIIFQSQSGNPEDVVWGYSLQSNSSNYVVLLRNVSHLTFRNLTFKALNQSAGRLIGLGINTSNITIENNICTGINTTSISTGYAIINSSDVVLDSISIRNNKFEFGSYAIRLSCNSDKGANITVEGNECVNHSYWSVQLQNIKNSKVLNNKINNQNSQGHGIWLYDLQSPISATENRIFAKNFGMLILRSDDITGERGLIANNFIHVTIDSSEGYGLSIFPINDTRVNIYYNTIRLVGNFSQNASSMVILNSDLSSQDIKNNIIINEVGGYAIRNSSSVTLSNYNDIVTTGAHLVRWNNINYPDIASYQTATGQDLNSISADPLFISSDDLHIKSGSPVDGKGTPLAEAPRDIDNQLRSLTTPDIGADEYTDERIIVKKRTNLRLPINAQTTTQDTLYIDPRDNTIISGYVLSDVNVFIDTLFHTNLADLEISLTHNGVTDTLAKFLPDSTSGFIGTILDDSGLLNLNEGVSPFTGSYRPYSPLSVFNGVDPEGDWVLEIYDRSSGNFGILDAWGIELVFEQTTGVLDEQEEYIIPYNFELSQNYPNPFNPSTIIRYSVPSRSTVILKIFDILGGEVSTLINEDKDAGFYSVNFNASQLSSGIYFYQLQAGSFNQVKKMILIK